MTEPRRGTVRIAAGQGFWGDWLEAPVRQVRGGPIDYLMMDYLAEVTMSIMQKQKSRDPAAGYARDFVPLMERIESLADGGDMDDAYETERQLLYVACTRARDFLLVSSGGPPSEYLADLQTPARGGYR